MITREQVADLQPGDVVELRSSDWHPDVVVRGPIRDDHGRIELGPLSLRYPAGTFADLLLDKSTLTVVSRAPRPLYVNHPRTEPAMGDVVSDMGNGGADWTWHRVGPDWLRADGADFDQAEMPKRLRLLVDGTTGEVVP